MLHHSIVGLHIHPSFSLFTFYFLPSSFILYSLLPSNLKLPSTRYQSKHFKIKITMVHSTMRRPMKQNRKTVNSVLTCVCAFFVTAIIALFLFELKILSGGSQVTIYLENDQTESTKKSSFNLANDQSFGFFNDIPDHEWNLLRKITSEHENHKFMDQPLTHNPAFDTRNLKYNNSPAAWYQTNYEPNFSCRFERRVGGNGNGDGPKVSLTSIFFIFFMGVMYSVMHLPMTFHIL